MKDEIVAVEQSIEYCGIVMAEVMLDDLNLL
jgi:hypothetical protein